MRYIQYARRSSDEHSHKQLQSIQGQEADLVRLVSDLGLNVVEKLEESRTAKMPGRKKVHPLGCHRPRVPDRQVLNGIFFVLRTGCQWRDPTPVTAPKAASKEAC